MIYLLFGQDNFAKEQKIAEIKAKAFPSAESLSFDYQVLYGHRLENDTLRESLMALPGAGIMRLVLIYQADELTSAQKTMIVELDEKSKGSLTVVLEAQELDKKDALLTKFGRSIKSFSFSPHMRHNVFDLMRAIMSHHKKEALEFLDELLKGGDYPLQIIAGMFWKWKNDKKQLSSKKFQEGLLAFEQADFHIKRSQLKPEYALELLVVKLCS